MITFRFEEFGDLPAARAAWVVVRQETEKDPEQHALFLVARKKASTPDPEAGKPADEKKARRALLDKKITEIIDLKAEKKLLQAQRLCQDIIQLYEDDKDCKEQVESARKLLAEKSKPDEPKDKAKK